MEPFRHFPPSLLKARLDFDFPPFILNLFSIISHSSIMSRSR